MSLRKLICPYDPSLIGDFCNREIAVQVDSPSLVCEAAGAVVNSANSLLCVILDSVDPVCAVSFEDQWKGIPILLMAPSVGEFRNVASVLPSLKKLNLRVCLPASNDNIRDVRILSSVGVHCSIMFEGGNVDWDALSDLMTYALLARVFHATIDPFDYISRHYNSLTHLNWGGAFLDDPEKYFHLDKEKNVALSSSEALAKQFIGRIDDVEKTESPEVQRRCDAWSLNFLENRVCATCDGFKLCMGRFLPKNGKADGCSAFFSEMIEIFGDLKAVKEKSSKEEVWRL